VQSSEYAVIHTLQSHRPASAQPHHAGYGEAIQWEELPSLPPSLVLRAPSIHAAAARLPKAQVWAETLPACLDPLQPSSPFREALEGLMTREVNEPDVFRHFFGEAAVAVRGSGAA
jgi:hypothetical protein